MLTIVKPVVKATIAQVNWLTRREQLVLAMLVGLFIVGWTVKIWRQSGASSPAAETIER